MKLTPLEATRLRLGISIMFQMGEVGSSTRPSMLSVCKNKKFGAFVGGGADDAIAKTWSLSSTTDITTITMNITMNIVTSTEVALLISGMLTLMGCFDSSNIYFNAEISIL